MSNIKYHPEIEKLEHDDSQFPQTKRVSVYGWDQDGLQKLRLKLNSDGSLASPLPTSGQNPEIDIAYTSGNPTTITKTVGSTQYQKTITYTDGKATNISTWVEI